MKWTVMVIFLSTLLAITNQKFYHPMGLSWYQQIAKYHQLYNNDHQYGNPFDNKNRASRPSAYYQDDELLNQGLNVSNTVNDESYNQNDVLSNNEGYINPALHDKYNPRFYYFGSASTYHNLIFKTATFTITSYINVTHIQICVPSTVFATGATTCRRKRSDIDLAWMDEPGCNQFYIKPTETQNVEPTLLLTADLIKKKSRYTHRHHGLTSSKQETNVDELESQNGHYKHKRFAFNQYVASLTITTYSFLTNVVTKTVNLAAKDSALCRPEGYVNCDQLPAEIPIG